MLFENYSLSSSTLSSKNNTRYSKKRSKIKCVCFNEVMWLKTMKMRLNMKNRSHRYDINRPRPRHGYRYTYEYKMCVSKILFTWITLWKFKNTGAELKKKKRWLYCINKSLLKRIWRRSLIFYCYYIFFLALKLIFASTEVSGRNLSKKSSCSKNFWYWSGSPFW